MKTIEEASEEYMNRQPMTNIRQDIAIMEAFKVGAEFAQRWISVDEELPEATMEIKQVGDYRYTKVQVLVRNKNRYWTSTRCYNPNHGWHWSEPDNAGNITHWRPIELE
jgi:hypothetical protein